MFHAASSDRPFLTGQHRFIALHMFFPVPCIVPLPGSVSEVGFDLLAS